MAYLKIKDRAVAIRQELKKQFPDWKFGITSENMCGGNSVIRVTIKSAPITFESLTNGDNRSISYHNTKCYTNSDILSKLFDVLKCKFMPEDLQWYDRSGLGFGTVINYYIYLYQ